MKLLTRQWKLYNLLKERTELNIKTTVADICDLLPGEYILNKKQSNFSNCPQLYADIDIINNSSEVSHIIIKNNNSFKLGTKEEVKKYMEKCKIRALRQFRKYWDIERKVELNGQGKLLSNQGNPIDEKSKAKAFFETFISELDVSEE